MATGTGTAGGRAAGGAAGAPAGLLPRLARPVLAALRRRRLLARWRRPARFECNLIVIGAGAAGLVAANVAAAAGARVTLIEAGPMGGDCLNTGCVPSKALIAAARAAQDVRAAGRFGITAAAPVVDFPAVMAGVDRAIAAIAPHDSRERYAAMGVEVLAGRARLDDPWTVAVALADGSTRRLTARAIVLATGAEPVLPDVEGIDEAGCLTTDTLWQRFRTLGAAPPRLVVLGGGAAGCELAQAMARLGSRVTLAEAAPRLLPREDADVGQAVRRALEAEGIRVITGRAVMACGRSAEGRWIEVAAGGPDADTDADRDMGRERIGCDEIIAATGRRARTEGLGLERLGLETPGIAAGGAIAADAFQRTALPHIFVAGDAAGPPHLTHAAAHQAAHAALNALAAPFWRWRADRAPIPVAVFVDPEVARIGLTEAEAAARAIPHEVTRYDLGDLDRAIADGTAQGFVKVLTAPGSDRVLGAAAVGTGAAEMLAGLGLAMTHGLGLKKVLATVHAYPTRAEAVRAVAGQWRRAHLGPRLLRLAGRLHRRRLG